MEVTWRLHAAIATDVAPSACAPHVGYMAATRRNMTATWRSHGGCMIVTGQLRGGYLRLQRV